MFREQGEVGHEQRMGCMVGDGTRRGRGGVCCVVLMARIPEPVFQPSSATDQLLGPWQVT